LKTDDYPLISEVKKGSVAYRSGMLTPGDRLMFIDHISLRGKSIPEINHLLKINEEIGYDVTPNETSTLKDLLKNEKYLEKHLEQLTEIGALASKEYALEQALKKMKSSWHTMNFNFVPYKDSKLFILSAFDDVQALLDDHIVKTTTMKNSPFVSAFESEVNLWDNELVSSSFFIFQVLKFYGIYFVYSIE
jgi:dynein heavy chain